MIKLTGFIACFIFSLAGLYSNAQFKKLVWADEFSNNGLPDLSKWRYDTGAVGWGNQEKGFYTNARLANASVKNGFLIIKAVREAC